MPPLRDTHYVDFKKGQGSKFLRLVKKKNFSSWERMAYFLDINRSMLFLYLREKSRLPYSSFKKLIRVSNIHPQTSSYAVIPSLKKGSPKIPQKITPELAEFIGVLLGDGNINKKETQITIAGGTIDGTYLYHHVPTIIKKLFSKESTTKRLKGEGVQCRFSSKEVCNYLTRESKLIAVDKKKCGIPQELFRETRLLKPCIRGLIDTDGGLHRHHQKNCQLVFTNKSFTLIESLEKGFKKLSYAPKRSYEKNRDIYKLYLFDKDVRRYFKEIGFNNPKHRTKFDRWIRHGFVPLNRDLVLTT